MSLKVEIWKCDSRGLLRSAGGWFIKKFQGTDYTHYALRLQGDESFYDASLTLGVSRSDPRDFYKCYKLVDEPWLLDVGSYIEFTEAMKPYMGKSYGLWQAIGIGLKWVFKWSKNPFGNGPKQIICNELVLRFVQHFIKKDLGKIDNLSLLETEKIMNKYLGDSKCCFLI